MGNITMRIRQGECASDKCETLDGKVGAACCNLMSGFDNSRCPHLQDNSKCELHNGLKKKTDYGFERKDKPGFCCVFPRQESELKSVVNCGYYFVEA